MAHGDFSTSLIVASRNRADRLAAMLARLPVDAMRSRGVELVLVDNGSEDATSSVMRDFCAAAPFPAQALFAETPGQYHAYLVATAAARGDLFAFTDDDCYVAPDYFDVLYREVDPDLYQYGAGEIVTHDPTDDPRVASTVWWTFPERLKVIPAGTVYKPGLVQGANMFFLRQVLDRLGGMQVLLEGDSDVATAIAASLAGFTGVMIRGLVVRHHHGRKRGSPEAVRTIESYTRGRGAYGAYLLARGLEVPWASWNGVGSGRWRFDTSRQLRGAALEFEGATLYLAKLSRERRIAEQADKADARPADDAPAPTD